MYNHDLNERVLPQPFTCSVPLISTDIEVLCNSMFRDKFIIPCKWNKCCTSNVCELHGYCKCRKHVYFRMFSLLFFCRKMKWSWRSCSKKWNHSETFWHFKTGESPNSKSRWPKWQSEVLLQSHHVIIWRDTFLRSSQCQKKIAIQIWLFLLVFFLVTLTWSNIPIWTFSSCFPLAFISE